MVRSWALVAAGVLGAVACHSDSRRQMSASIALEQPSLASNEPVAPLPEREPQDPAHVALGQALFFSNVVSDDGLVSCGTCHLPEHGFADRTPLTHASGGRDTSVNTPTLLNVVYLDNFNWTGKHSDLGAHLDALIENPRIVGTSWGALSARLRRDSEWVSRFDRAFGERPTPENTRAALLAYEASLVSPPSAFDRWLGGSPEAISAEAREGYGLFKSRGCASCHQGSSLGGNLFQRLGVVKPYFEDPARVHEGDWGRFNVTGREEDRHVFRVPSLRNVALTGPYLHDGSLPTLEATVRVMSTYQLGRELGDEQVRLIVLFLETLSGDATPEVR